MHVLPAWLVRNPRSRWGVALLSLNKHGIDLRYTNKMGNLFRILFEATYSWASARCGGLWVVRPGASIASFRLIIVTDSPLVRYWYSGIENKMHQPEYRGVTRCVRVWVACGRSSVTIWGTASR